MGGVRCVMGGLEVCGRGEVCVCVCVEGARCVGGEGWMWVEGVKCMGGGSLSVLLYIVYRCSHMCIVCVLCVLCVCVCVRVVCVCVCVVWDECVW